MNEDLISKSIGVSPLKARLFYDESNNYRKLLLTKNGINNPIDNQYFVLGGIAVFDKNPNIEKLMIALNHQKSVKEFKFKYFSYGKTDFIKILYSDRLLTFFRWVNDEKIGFHYSVMNYLYWALIDIVDEVHEQYGYPGQEFDFSLKSAMFDSIKPYLPEFIEIMRKYNYPNIADKDIHSFAMEVLTFVEEHQMTYENDDPADFYVEYLRQIIKALRSKQRMVFLKGNPKNTLMESYSSHYYCEILRFPNCELVFDNEPVIKKALTKMNINQRNYRFVNSTEEILVQLSDVFCSFYSKYLSYCESKTTEEIENDVKNMSFENTKILRLFLKIEHESNRKDEKLFLVTAPISTRDKCAFLDDILYKRRLYLIANKIDTSVQLTNMADINKMMKLNSNSTRTDFSVLIDTLCHYYISKVTGLIRIASRLSSCTKDVKKLIVEKIYNQLKEEGCDANDLYDLVD